MTDILELSMGPPGTGCVPSPPVVQAKHFWFSAQQIDNLRWMNRHMCRTRGGPVRHLFALIDGKEVEYSEMTDNPEYMSHWPDVIYLGQGQFLREGGVI